MGDYCDMRLTITGPPTERERCVREIGGDFEGEKIAIDFARIIPPPDPPPADEPSLLAWRRDNWGVNAQPGPHDNTLFDEDAEKSVIILATKTRPPLPVITEVAARFRQLEFTLVFHHEALILGGYYRWIDGALAVEETSTDSDQIVGLLEHAAPDIAEAVRMEHGLDGSTESGVER